MSHFLLSILNNLFVVQRVYAQDSIDFHGGPTNLTQLIDILRDIINISLPIITGLALIAFLWGLIKFISRAGEGDEKAVGEGKKLMTWGLIALFVLVAYAGILAFFFQDIGFSGPFGIPLFK